jgi:hypothetical protein
MGGMMTASGAQHTEDSAFSSTAMECVAGNQACMALVDSSDGTPVAAVCLLASTSRIERICRVAMVQNVRLVGNSPGPCQLRVTIQDKTSSQGHNVSLTSVIATQGRVDLNAFWSGKDLDKVLQHEGDA